jgi:peptidoglycan LD-endopeptidase CwlK
LSDLITALHPKVIDGRDEVICEAKARGLNVGMFSGLRLNSEQEKLYALGRTVINPDGKTAKKPLGNIITNARSYESWHCFGLAIDLVFKDGKGHWTWNKTPEQWAELGAVGEMFGFSWGGHWTKFPDYPHFQMRGKIPNIQTAKKILLLEGRDKLWNMV